ncbi:TIR domain-containing protein (plasmid) [Rhizobium leguminosarum]
MQGEMLNGFGLRWPRSALAALDRFADGLFGYDVFIAYRRKDGEPYVRALDAALSARGYACFVDFREYRPGEPLAAATKRHVSKATVLVVLGTPAILENRNPDWVLLEIETFLQGKEGTAAKLVPVDFSGTLASGKDISPIARLLTNGFIWQCENSAPQSGSPTVEVVDAIVTTIGAQRRERRRLRFFRWLAAVFLVLTAVSTSLAIAFTIELDRSQKNLAASRKALSDVYMNEARRRLNMMDVNGANAFAAASLAQLERGDARQLIFENPAISIRTVYGREEGWGIWALDYDATHDRFLIGDSNGDIRLLDGADFRQETVLKTAIRDIDAIKTSPKGTYTAIGHENGATDIRLSDALASEPVCVISPFEAPPSRGRSFTWLSDTDLLVVENEGLYLASISDHCKSSGPLAKTMGGNKKVAFDPTQSRLFVVDGAAIHRYHWNGGRLEEDAVPYRLPVPPGEGESWGVGGIVWFARLDELAVLVNEGRLLLFGSDFNPRSSIDIKTLAPGSSDFITVRDMAVSTDGRHLLIADDSSLIAITADRPEYPQFRLEFRIPGVLDFRPAQQMIGAVRDFRAEPPDADFSVITADRLGQKLLSSELSGDPDRYFGAMDVSPDGRLVAISTTLSASERHPSQSADPTSGKVQLVDTTTGATIGFPTGMRAAQWLKFDPSGRYIGVSTGGSIAIFALDGTVVHRQYNLGSVSPTGYENAVWFSDSSGILLTSDWYDALMFSTDPSMPAAVTSGLGRKMRGKLSMLPRNRFASVSSVTGISVWDAAANTETSLPLPDDVYVGDFVSSLDGRLYLASRAGAIVVSIDGPLALERLPGTTSGDDIMVSADGGRIVISGNGVVNADRTAIAAHPAVPLAKLYRLAPDGSTLYAITSEGTLFSIDLALMDKSATELSEMIGESVGIGQQDLAITRPGVAGSIAGSGAAGD